MFNEFIINKNNLINNIKQVKKENPKSMVCAMVKANAYGVGDIQTVDISNDYVDFYGVACFFEAKRIKNHTTKPILIFGAIEKDNIDTNFRYTCSCLDDVNFLISLNKPMKIHLKVNTGMNRYGFKDVKDFKQALLLINKSKLIVEGLFTHFATTDEFVKIQMKKFNEFYRVCKKFGINPIVHVDNSFVNEKFNHGLDMVRIGFSLYNRNENLFLPVVEIKSKIVQVQNVKKGELVGYDYRYVAKKAIKIGIIPIGYADGFDLKLIGMEIYVGNVKCKVLNISMDCLMLDISNSKLKKGDDVYILNKHNSLKAYAEYLKTSQYEILTKFNNLRADRIIS